jgi:hypothetical protein
VAFNSAGLELPRISAGSSAIVFALRMPHLQSAGRFTPHPNSLRSKAATKSAQFLRRGQSIGRTAAVTGDAPSLGIISAPASKLRTLAEPATSGFGVEVMPTRHCSRSLQPG